MTPTQEKNIAWVLPRPKPDHYKGGMPLYAEDWLLNLALKLLKSSSVEILNLFCGMNKQGFRVDINPEVKPDHLADAHTFAKHWNKNLFDIILADPPYSNEESKELYGTGKINYKQWTEQCDMVLKPGGLLIIYHKYMMPNPNPKKYEVVKRVFIGRRTYHVPRVAIYFRKKILDPEELKLEKKDSKPLSPDKKRCHVCGVEIGEKHKPFCSVGNDVFGQ